MQGVSGSNVLGVGECSTPCICVWNIQAVPWNEHSVIDVGVVCEATVAVSAGVGKEILLCFFAGQVGPDFKLRCKVLLHYAPFVECRSGIIK